MRLFVLVLLLMSPSVYADYIVVVGAYDSSSAMSDGCMEAGGDCGTTFKKPGWASSCYIHDQIYEGPGVRRYELHCWAGECPPAAEIPDAIYGDCAGPECECGEWLGECLFCKPDDCPEHLWDPINGMCEPEEPTCQELYGPNWIPDRSSEGGGECCYDAMFCVGADCYQGANGVCDSLEPTGCDPAVECCPPQVDDGHGGCCDDLNQDGGCDSNYCGENEIPVGPQSCCLDLNSNYICDAAEDPDDGDCPEGYTWWGGRCVWNDPAPPEKPCPAGTVRTARGCVPKGGGPRPPPPPPPVQPPPVPPTQPPPVPPTQPPPVPPTQPPPVPPVPPGPPVPPQPPPPPEPPDPDCPPGSVQVGDMCEWPPDCPPGYTLEGQWCVPPTVCPVGTTLVGDECLPPLECPEGAELVGDECVMPPVCPEGTELIDGECIAPQECPEGTELIDGQCVGETECPPGWTLGPDGETCLPDACPTGTFRDENGDCIAYTDCPAGTTRDELTGECIPIFDEGQPIGTVPRPGEFDVEGEYSELSIPGADEGRTLADVASDIGVGWQASPIGEALAGLDFSIPSSSCPVFSDSIPFFGRSVTLTIDAHCQFWTVITPLVSALSLMAYTLIAARAFIR